MDASQMLCLSVVLVFGLSQVSVVLAWSGHVCTRQASYTVYQKRCTSMCWILACCRHQYYPVTRYYYVNYCCTGWKHNGNKVCNIPICLPTCYNGGTCINPNKCRCPPQYHGDLCATLLCSDITPCYPGTCGTGVDTCRCSRNFEGGTCDTMVGDTPQLTTVSAYLSEIDRASNEEQYRLYTDATDPDSPAKLHIFWSNLDRYNYLTVHWEGFHLAREDLPPLPHYIRRSEFGIVYAITYILHKKLAFGGGDWVIASSKSRECAELVSSKNPEVGIFNCTREFEDFYTRIEHHDRLTITVEIKNGGYRQLIRPGLGEANDKFEIYNGLSTEKMMEFRFDFRPPTHCAEYKNCIRNENPLYIEDGIDIRKESFTVRWNGWKDDLALMWRYVWEVFKLEPDRDGKLTEPLEPVILTEVNATDNYIGQYTPDLPGMYSIVLEASDTANNSKYSRRLVLYDPIGTVEINNASDSRLYFSSAGKESDYQWQGDLDGPVNVTWANHFRNTLHEDNAFLNVVLPYPAQRLKRKNVSDALDDHEGSRTIKSINNTHGIVRGEYYVSKDSQQGKTCTPIPPIPSNHWVELPESAVLEETWEFNTVRNDGDTVCMWIRTYDVLDNNATDLTMVHFDITPPAVQEMELDKINSSTRPPGSPFASRVRLATKDDQSGVYMIKWRLMDDISSEVLGSSSVDNRWSSVEVKRRRKKRSICNDFTRCYCIPRESDTCFQMRNEFSLPHCAIRVPKDRLESLLVRVEVDAVNGAGYWTMSSAMFGTVTDLEELVYSAPYNFSVMDKSHLSATLHWSNQPNCYNRTAIKVEYKPVSAGEFETITVYRDAREISLNGLKASTNYTLKVYNWYDEEISDPSTYYFITADDPPITVGEIVGLVIGILLLLVIAGLVSFMVVLWRRGQLRTTIQRRYTQARSLIRNNVRRDPLTRRTTFITHMNQSDDLYIYGNMSFDVIPNWEIRGGDLDLQDVIADGRFARVYKAALTKASCGPTVIAAKTLKVTNLKSEEILVMKAKINFMAGHALQHENVIQFIGAINDDKERGPIMLLEYYGAGTLIDWLSKQRMEGKVNEEIVDKLWHFSLDIAKGMEYLASKNIVHRKLAARNILLDSTLNPKITGFGPVPDELDDNQDKTKGERLPLKWMAPELLKARSTKEGTEKSDVWAYGIVVWEIFSLGEQPYSDIRSRDIAGKLKQGKRLMRLELMPDEHDGITKRCWNQMPEDRPSFSVLVNEQSLAFDNRDNATYYDSWQMNNYYS